MKWYRFDQTKGSYQKRPPEKRYVLVLIDVATPGLPDGIAVGYRKDAAGDKQCPYFVVPGIRHARVLGWCDCLPETFQWPLKLTKKT